MIGVLETLNQFAGSAFASVLNTLWQAVALAVAVWTVLKFTPRMNAATRHIVWWAVLGVVLMLPLVPPAPEPWQQLALASPASIAVSNAGDSPSLRSPVSAPPASAPSASMRLLPFELRAGNWSLGVAAVWLAVFLFQLGRIGSSFLHLRRMKRTSRLADRELRTNFDVWMLACGVHRPSRLLVSKEVVSPLAIGFLRPAVILPEALIGQFQPSELDHVLLHELAHVARRDDWTNLAARLASAVVALHPVAAWILRRIEREREIACDDWVVSMTGAARPYAESLARLFELCSPRRRESLAAAMAGAPSQLGERIEMLLRRGREFTPCVSFKSVALSATVLLAFAMADARMPQWIAFAQDVPPTPPAAPAPPAAPEPPAPPAPHAQAVEPLPPRAPDPPTAPQAPAPNAPPEPPSPPQSATGRTSFLAALVAAGYGNLSVDDIISLRTHGITAEFLTGINQSGWGKLTAGELTDLAAHGVSPEYVRDMRDAGLRNLTLKDVIDLRAHGVDQAYLRQINSAGYGPYTKQEVIDFASHGVEPGLFRALKDAGFSRLEPREIVEAQANGIGPSELREAKQYGKSLTLRQIIRLKQAGVI